MRTLFFNLFAVLFIALVFSCCNVYDRTVNVKDLSKVQKKINNDNELKPMKKKYINDNLEMYARFAEMGNILGASAGDLKTFREYIGSLKMQFDSIEAVKINTIKNNKKLEDFITIISASVTPIKWNRGYLTMDIRFKNEFDKPVKSTVMLYEFTDNSGFKRFSSMIRIGVDVAKNFKDDVELNLIERNNDAASFMYNKVPIRATLKLREELGEEAANKKVQNDFLMEGLKGKALNVVFQDDTEINFQNVDWEYLMMDEVS